MNNREMLEKLVGDINFDPADMVWHPHHWRPVLVGDNTLPYMKISDDLGGMTMVATWVRSDKLQEIQHDDLVDMCVGADGRTKN